MKRATFLLITTMLVSVPAIAANVLSGELLPDERGLMNITTHVVKPYELPAPEISQLKVPDGFVIEKFAENLGNPRVLAVAPDGTVYVTRRTEADVLMFRLGKDGKPARAPVQVAARAGIHGLALHKGKAYIATVHEIFRADIKPDGTFGPLTMIVHDLPDAGQHHTRTVKIGPDNMMYISVGSTCNECPEPNPEAATMLRASLDGKHRSIFASGLRDTIGWDWNPTTGVLWGMDHGIDWMGDDMPEELNRLEKGKFYGWPYVFGDNQINPHTTPTGGLTSEDYQKKSTPMVMGYNGHAAPMQLTFYNASQFPAEYKGDAFISMHGSWNRKNPSGYEVVRIRFKNGEPTAFESFVTGFLTEKGETGRPFGTAVAKDGSLLFTDDRNGIIYRVYAKAGATSVPESSGAADIPNTVKPNPSSPIAFDTPETRTTSTLNVTSRAFSDGTSIPLINSAYDQNVSIPLGWTKGPESTKSYALFMEDPDADTETLPVIHWIAWNIPATVTSLGEGLPTAPRLTMPEDMRQGTNVTGGTGYTGPKPPEAGKPHRYIAQVYALDTKLDLPVGATRQQLLDAVRGHVLAKGRLQGMFTKPEHPAKP